MRNAMKAIGIYSRLGVVSAVSMILAAATGCSVEASGPAAPIASETQSVSAALATSPTFVAKTGAVTIALKDETVELYLDSADSSLRVNGSQVFDSSGSVPVAAIAAGSKSNVKTIAITDTTGTKGDVVIMNYANGTFGTGSKTAAATTISLVAGKSNALVLKATSGADSIAFGQVSSKVGISLNNAAPTWDIAPTNVASYTVFLGAGDDKFTAAGNAALTSPFTAGVTVYGGDGNDTLVEGSASTPGEIFSGGNGTDTVDYSARTAAVSVAIDPLGVITSGASPKGTDPTAGATEGDEILDAEVITGGSGNDMLMGGLTGHATLNGGPGNDLFFQGDDTYNAAIETMNGGGGIDTVDYSKRKTNLSITMDGKTASGNTGGTEADIIGTDVSNVKSGGKATTTCTIVGNALDNVFYPGLGTNSITGGAGDDTLIEGGDTNLGNDTFIGGSGIDTVDYSLRTQVITVVMDGNTASGDLTNSEADKIDTTVENLYGGSGDDVLTGNAADNDIEGNAGDDTIVGLGGNDTLLGASASGSMENNVIHGNDGADTAEVGAFNMCINIGTGSSASPANAAAAPAANCEVATF